MIDTRVSINGKEVSSYDQRTIEQRVSRNEESVGQIGTKLDEFNPVVSWNDLADKPFYETGGDFSFNGNTSGKLVCDRWVKISQVTPSFSEIEGSVYRYCYYFVETEYLMSDPNKCIQGENCYRYDLDIAVAFTDNAVLDNGTVLTESGLYFGYGNPVSYTSGLKYGSIVTIDEKFLPKVSGLPEVTSENNGAFMRVVNGQWTVSTLESAEGASF